jgi:transposase
MGNRVITDRAQLDSMSETELRSAVAGLLERIGRDAQEIAWRDARIEKLSFEMAVLKRIEYGRMSEKFSGEQRQLFDEARNEDLASLEEALDDLKPPVVNPEKKQPKRAALPEHLPRTDIHHEPEITICRCGCALKRIGEDVSEKLDYIPGVVRVERHIRGKWVCKACETLIQAPVSPAIINKGIPTAGLLAQVLIAKHHDHLPLYRQEKIFARAGLSIPQSTLCSWAGAAGAKLQPLVEALKRQLLERRVLHADETPVARLSPGEGKTHRSYLWAYASGEFDPFKAVVYDFADSRSGQHARDFLGDWSGSLVCDDYSGYKACFGPGVIEAGCMAHARRKFTDLYESNKSPLAATALDYIRQLYALEAEIKQRPEQRLQVRRARSAEIAGQWREWMIGVRARVTEGSAIAKALDYSLNRWGPLMRFLEDPKVPIDNNHDERQIRPWATGRKNWLFAGSLLAGQRAAAITSLIQTAKLNQIDPYVYLKDVLQRLPTQKMTELDQLLPPLWIPAPT